MKNSIKTTLIESAANSLFNKIEEKDYPTGTLRLSITEKSSFVSLISNNGFLLNQLLRTHEKPYKKLSITSFQTEIVDSTNYTQM